MNNLIITKFITKEVGSIYQKYNSLSEDEVSLVSSIIKIVEEN